MKTLAEVRNVITSRAGLPQLYVGDRADWLHDEGMTVATLTNEICPFCFAPSRRLWWLPEVLFACISTTRSRVFSSGPNRTDASTLMAITADFEQGFSIRATAKRNGVAKETAYRQKMIQRAMKAAQDG
jgi:hypothetical protein